MQAHPLLPGPVSVQARSARSVLNTASALPRLARSRRRLSHYNRMGRIAEFGAPGGLILPPGTRSIIGERASVKGPGLVEREGESDQRIPAGDLAAMRAIAAGDDAAFARLIDREGPVLLRFARSLLGSEHDAEDVVQECFIRLWENAQTWRPEASLRSWLHRVCYNASIDRLRRRRGDLDIADVEIPDDAELPDHGLLQKEGAAGVRHAIDRLSPRQKTAILLFHIQDMSQADAARTMEIGEDAFESLLARGRRRLRSLLGPASEEG